MTKLKLNVYRAEDEFITMQRLQWRREEEENKKERKKVIMMMADCRTQNWLRGGSLCSSQVEKEMAALRAQQNREWRERREEARKEEVKSISLIIIWMMMMMLTLSSRLYWIKFSEQELSGRCCDVERDCGVEEALRQELRQRSSLHCAVLWGTL